MNRLEAGLAEFPKIPLDIDDIAPAPFPRAGTSARSSMRAGRTVDVVSVRAGVLEGLARDGVITFGLNFRPVSPVDASGLPRSGPAPCCYPRWVVRQNIRRASEGVNHSCDTLRVRTQAALRGELRLAETRLAARRKITSRVHESSLISLRARPYEKLT